MNPFFEGVLKAIGQKAVEAAAGAIGHKSPPNNQPTPELSTSNVEELYRQGYVAWSKDDKYLAVECWRVAAELGHTKAQCSLGMSYHSGLGCVKNDEEAVKWLNAAAQKGDQQAIELLKSMRVWKDHGWVLGAGGKP